MGLFGLGKITTLTFFVCLFEDKDHRMPLTELVRNSFGAKFIPALIEKHYTDSLKPKKN